MTLFQTTAASTTSVAVAVPTLPLHSVVSSQHFAEPAQTEAFVSPGLNFSLKRPAPVFTDSFSSRNPSNISTTSGRFSVANSEIPGISVFPRGIALPPSYPFYSLTRLCVCSHWTTSQFVWRNSSVSILPPFLYTWTSLFPLKVTKPFQYQYEKMLKGRESFDLQKADGAFRGKGALTFL